MIKEISRKTKMWFSVLWQQGFIQFLITGLEFIQKRKNTKSGVYQNGPVYTKARYNDILATDLASNRPKWSGSTKSSLDLAWIMPPPGKGSGGHLNIFRFMQFLERAGHTCKIYLFTDGSHGTISAVKASMGDSYPKIAAFNNMEWLEAGQNISPTDGIFATSWETAYASYRLASKAKRFYFVQDFEPYFYPVGGMYTLAENTYRLGFYGVTAGNWLKRKLSREYGMKTDSFDFGSDEDTYRFTNDGNRQEIFYYARPYTERRGFEVGILTLNLFHKKHPEYIINLVGWDVSSYDIPFPHKNLKTLEISELSDLYNRCAAGLVLSYTNMSLLPLELLRCGTIPVVNDGDNNRLVSDNPYIAYSRNDPHSLANTLSKVVSRQNKAEYAKKASESVKSSSWSLSGSKFVKIVENEMKNNG